MRRDKLLKRLGMSVLACLMLLGGDTGAYVYLLQVRGTAEYRALRALSNGA